MTYYPRVRLSERNGRIQDGVPASGVVAGLLSQNDQSGMWRKLEEGDMRLKAGLSLIENVADRQHLMLHRNRVNIFPVAVRAHLNFAAMSLLPGLESSRSSGNA